MAVQLVSFYFIRYAIQTTAESTMRDELRVASRVVRRVLDQNVKQLAEATSAFGHDDAFRDALLRRDTTRLLPELRERARRFGASAMGLLTPEGVVIAGTLVEEGVGRPYPFADLFERAQVQGSASGIRVVNGKLYQIVMGPVLAPQPVAWATMGFLIDDNVARDLRYLTSVDVSFLQVVEGKTYVRASSLNPAQRNALASAAGPSLAHVRHGATIEIGGEDYAVLSDLVDDSGALPIHAVLQRALSDGLQAYRLLEVALLFIAGLSLAVTLVGAMRISRRITRPVTRLADAAARVERGEYGTRVGDLGDDEIGALGRAFDRMTQGLAERDNMRDVLGKVASTEVVKQLLEGKIELGGEEREVTILFVDIRNFTGIVEKLPPAKSLALLNEFLTAVSGVIEAHGGVVDKYLGDGVLALFGAPVTRPDDAARALACALEIRRQVDALRPDLVGRGFPEVQLGIGVNTARVIAGNIGSPSRLNYTVLGDGVNLASRLEGLARRYEVSIVAGESTRNKVPDVTCRELDKVRVKGRTVAERVFEPLGPQAKLRTADIERLALWHESLDLFRRKCWDAAEDGFAKLAGDPAYARLVEIYRGYIAELRATPPPEDWDASFTLYDK